jgi:hypothetical protein
MKQIILLVLLLASLACSQQYSPDPDVEIQITVVDNQAITEWEVFWEERVNDSGWILVAGVQYDQLTFSAIDTVQTLGANQVMVPYPTIQDGLWVRAGAVGRDNAGLIVTEIGVSQSYHKALNYESVVPSVIILNLEEQ